MPVAAMSPGHASTPPAQSAAPLRRMRRRPASAPTIRRPTASYSPAVLANTVSAVHLANLQHLLQQRPQAPTPPPPPLPADGEYRRRRHRDGFFQRLDLSGILPSTSKKTADMSPRSRNMFRRLLSEPARPSPRGGIAGRWRRLHGSHDWAGLLDPLDEDLRREIVRYGEFVQAAYHAFHSDAGGHRRRVALPDRSYRLTRDLLATSSIEAPRWAAGMAPWVRQRSSWVGFVAVCDGEREIQRMGRRDIVIALRGTATALEWAENFRVTPVGVSGGGNADPAAAEPKVEHGFWSLFTTGSEGTPSLRDVVVGEVRRLLNVYRGEQLSITITGHSLGAALAILVADELSAGGGADMPPIAVFSFGGPHVGNGAFAERVRARGVKVLRVVNERDVITKVPGVFAGQKKVAAEEDQRGGGGGDAARRRWRRAAAAASKRLRLADKWFDAVDRVMRAWAYAHVGSELRVDSRHSPYLKPDADPGCCHDLEAYLHLVDGFLSSRCPFRENAKRSIAKLVTHQGSNLKKHYTSHALAAALGMGGGAAADEEGGGGCPLRSPTS